MFLELRSIIDCSRHDVSGEGVVEPRCEPILGPTMQPEGSAADIRVNPSDHRVADIHSRGHLIARLTPVEQSKDISYWSTRHVGWGCNCARGVPYTIEDQVVYYLRFSDVISHDMGKIGVSKKTD